MKEFEKFLNLSNLISERNLKSLFNVLNRYHGDYENPELSLELIYNSLFGKKKFSEKYLTSLMSDLYKTAKYFLAVKEVFNNEVLYNKIISEEFLKRNLKDEFEKQIKTANELLDKKFSKSKNYFKDKEELTFINSMYLDTKKDYDKYLNSYLESMNYSAFESLLKLFRHNSELYNFKLQNFIGDEFNLSEFLFNSINFEKLISEIEGIHEDYKTKIKLYYFLSILNKKKSIPFYNEAKELFFKNRNLFGKEQKREIYFQFMNFCSYMAITRDDLTSEVFEFNKTFLYDEDKLFLENNFFDRRLFRNIALCAIQLNENNWAINFINENKIYLEKEAEDNLVYYLLGVAYSRLREYEKSLEILSKVKFNYGTYKEDILILKAATLFELGYYVESYETLISFKKTFKKTSAMSKGIYNYYNNSINFFLKFLNIVLKNKYSDLNFLEVKLKECEEISIKSWLLGKINDFKIK
ncbi:MAG TPA: hypothetical protein PLG90_01105 [Ignavibacteria bacterium]|nr:hypothetical protein [Ignavibacteria bacterium]